MRAARLVSLLLLGRGQALGCESALEVAKGFFFDELRKGEGKENGKIRWKGSAEA